MEVSAASEADEAAEVIEVGEDLNGSEIIHDGRKPFECTNCQGVPVNSFYQTVLLRGEFRSSDALFLYRISRFVLCRH